MSKQDDVLDKLDPHYPPAHKRLKAGERKLANYSMRTANMRKLTELSDEAGVSKSGMVNALISLKHQELFEEE